MSFDATSISTIARLYFQVQYPDLPIPEDHLETLASSTADKTANEGITATRRSLKEQIEECMFACDICSGDPGEEHWITLKRLLQTVSTSVLCILAPLN